ncbi:transposase [Halomonas casei]|nr:MULTISPECIES: transposase [Halomonas]
MDRINSIRTGRHCVFEIHAHLVFVTKYRGRVFNVAHLNSLETLFRQVCRDFEAELKEFNGEFH